MPPKGKKQKDTPSHSQAPSPPPNWPPLKPLIPSSDLYLETILEDQIYLIRNLLTSTLCKSYVSFLSSLPLITTPKRPKKDEAVRVNDRFQIDDAGFAERLWSGTALKELVMGVGRGEGEGEDPDEDGPDPDVWGGDVLGLNSNIRIYRYTPGQFFGQHYDESVSLQFSTPPVPAKTTWTLLIYLTTCTGGETIFYPEESVLSPRQDRRKQQQHDLSPISVDMEVGMALLHRHGEKCLLHEGGEVKGGEKWVIRSDLVVRR